MRDPYECQAKFGDIARIAEVCLRFVMYWASIGVNVVYIAKITEANVFFLSRRQKIRQTSTANIEKRCRVA